MPYRRLPNTDQARLRALDRITDLEQLPMGEIPVSYHYLSEAETQRNIFQSRVQIYNQTFENQVNANKKYQQIVKNARIYISHFIQVLNLAVIRGEIKKEYKAFYKLDPDDNTLPELNSEQAVTDWGRNIIDGENERMRNGGAPLQNPSIAKVKVHYDIFKEYKMSQKTHQSSTTKRLDEVSQLRITIDELIRTIWDEIEKKYADLPPYERWQACTKCGIIYYLRKGEEEPKPTTEQAY